MVSTAAANAQLARLVEDCLHAEREQPGASAAIVQGAPVELRTDLEQILAVGRALRRISSQLGGASRISPSGTRDVRARIMRRITR